MKKLSELSVKDYGVNHVNLIGKITSDIRIAVQAGGRKTAHFSLTTKESFLDEDGNVCIRQNWHRMKAWGRLVVILEELCSKGANVAVEGKLLSHFHTMENGQRRMVSEIEVNDLVLL